jgi:hypothetical protein
MREVSEAEFMRFAVAEIEPTIYNAWETGVYAGGIDMNNVLNICIRTLFVDRALAGGVCDYVRDIAVAQQYGSLQWVS